MVGGGHGVVDGECKWWWWVMCDGWWMVVGGWWAVGGWRTSPFFLLLCKRLAHPNRRSLYNCNLFRTQTTLPVISNLHHSGDPMSPFQRSHPPRNSTASTAPQPAVQWPTIARRSSPALKLQRHSATRPLGQATTSSPQHLPHPSHTRLLNRHPHPLSH